MTNSASSDGRATRWSPFEIALDGPDDGNPFADVDFSATFRQGGRDVRVTGFYDGDGVYRTGCLPDVEGDWTYETSSNVEALDRVRGQVGVGPAEPGHHGPVRVSNTHHFRHADGTRYVNIGTTAYVWNLQGDEMEEQTLGTLAEAPFTKIRMCGFPKHYRCNQNEPERYPFALKKGSSA